MPRQFVQMFDDFEGGDQAKLRGCNRRGGVALFEGYVGARVVFAGIVYRFISMRSIPVTYSATSASKARSVTLPRSRDRARGWFGAKRRAKGIAGHMLV